MSASSSSRRRARLAASALFAGFAALIALSACSAGQIAQTAQEVAAVPGANADIGPDGLVALRDVAVAYNGPQGYPQGGSAPLVVRIFNQGTTKVTLVKVSAGDAATGVVLVGTTVALPSTPPTPTTGPSGSTTPSTSATPSSSATPSGSARPSGSASPSSSPSVRPTPTPTPGQSTFAIDVDPLSFAVLVPGQGAFLQLTGLTAPLIPGESVPLTFTFADGSSGQLEVPVGVPQAPQPRLTPDVNVTEVELEHE